jgi:hypothetical protein
MASVINWQLKYLDISLYQDCFRQAWMRIKQNLDGMMAEFGQAFLACSKRAAAAHPDRHGHARDRL